MKVALTLLALTLLAGCSQPPQPLDAQGQIRLCQSVTELGATAYRARARGVDENRILALGLKTLHNSLLLEPATAIVHFAYTWPVAPTGNPLLDRATALDVQKAAATSCLLAMGVHP